jgi:hypothetical protein
LGEEVFELHSGTIYEGCPTFQRNISSLFYIPIELEFR